MTRRQIMRQPETNGSASRADYWLHWRRHPSTNMDDRASLALVIETFPVHYARVDVRNRVIAFVRQCAGLTSIVHCGF